MHLGARYYMPEVGRFLQRDPGGEDAHPYSYALGNPMYLVDPNGEASVIPAGHVVCTKGKVNYKIVCPWPLPSPQGSQEFDTCKEVCASPPQLVGPLAPSTVTGKTGPKECCQYTITFTGNAYHCEPKKKPGKPGKPG
jgi:hypothetical protein